MTTIVNKYYFYFLFFLLPLTKTAYAQIVIGKPSLQFSQVCANVGFNTFNVIFTFSPAASLSPTNQFIVEYSDPVGNFTNPNVLFT